MHREELMYWLHDHRREEEEKRERESQGNRQSIYQDDIVGDSRTGFDRSSFNLGDTRSTILSRPLH